MRSTWAKPKQKDGNEMIALSEQKHGLWLGVNVRYVTEA